MYARVDVTQVANAAEGFKRVLERWTSKLMGSQFCRSCVLRLLHVKRLLWGGHLEIDNQFYQDKVILNLPGTKEYDPTMPKLYRWNLLMKSMACLVGTYSDDTRRGRPTEEACKATSRRVAYRINYLGQQVAIKKKGSLQSSCERGQELGAAWWKRMECMSLAWMKNGPKQKSWWRSEEFG